MQNKPSDPSHVRQNNPQPRNRHRSGGSFVANCWNCNDPNHIKRFCPLLTDVRPLRGPAPVPTQSSSSFAATKERHISSDEMEVMRDDEDASAVSLDLIALNPPPDRARRKRGRNSQDSRER